MVYRLQIAVQRQSTRTLTRTLPHPLQARTPIGLFGGSLASLSAPKLGGIVIAEALKVGVLVLPAFRSARRAPIPFRRVAASPTQIFFALPCTLLL